MASATTYAKLIPPAMFKPEETVKFRLEFSNDLILLYATLVIDGYEEANYPAMNPDYTGTKVTQELHTSIAGQGYTEFVLPPNTLGFSPDENTDMVLHLGKMKARVLFGDTLTDGHVTEPLFISNETFVDMFIMADGDFKFVGIPYNADSSVFTAELYYVVNYDFGSYGSTDIKSYRIYLYDSNHKLIEDSGELYDWNTGSTSLKQYKFRDLKDNSTYYVKARLTTNGGYIINTDYETITVDYADTPIISDKLALTNVTGGVQLDGDLSASTHTSVVILRSIVNESDYIELAKIEITGNEFTYIDNYAIPTRRYIYKVVVYNDAQIVATYYSIITCEAQAAIVTISDVWGSYSAIADVKKHPVSRNDRGSYIEPMESKYPFFIVNGSPDYDSGTVEGIFAEVENCEIKEDNEAYSNALRAWLNNGRAKLLTYYTGEAWIVSVTSVSTQDPNNNDLYDTSFAWTQVGNADLMDEYVKNGLVIEYD